MANVLNRTTKQFLRSVNTPDYSELDWVINPNLIGLEDIPLYYLVVELDDTIREMTEFEKSDYNLANPDTMIMYYNSALLNGVPSYLYLPLNIKVSIQTTTLVYSTKTTGSKNYWLNTANVDGSISGYLIPVKSIIKRVSLSSKSILGNNIILKFKNPDDPIVYLELPIVASTSKIYTIDNLTALLPANIQLSCYLSSLANVSDIVVTIEIAQRD